jgi:hypothetical protein
MTLDRTGKSRQIGTVAELGFSRHVLKILIFIFAVRVHSRRVFSALPIPRRVKALERPGVAPPAPGQFSHDWK